MKKITDYAELVKAKHALNKTIAPVEDGANMAGSYTTGQQFIRDGVLYTALTSIAASTAFSSLTLDTDYEVADDITSQLSSVNSALTNEVVTRAKLGGHNLLNHTAVTTSSNNVTFTVNADRSITASSTGSSSGTTTLFLVGSLNDFAPNNYVGAKLSGVPSGGGNDTWRIVCQLSSDGSSVDNTVTDDGTGATIPNYPYIKIYIRIAGSVNLTTPKTFYPMLRLATDSDTTYQPYSMTNQEITSLLSVYKTGNIIASDAVSVNSSHILRFGKVISIHVDFTVGNTAIPAWDTSFLKIPSAILPEGITGTMQNASTVMQSVLDFTNDVAKLGYVSLAMGASGADKGFFSNRSFLANTRYNIGMTFIIPPTS